jgi:hypothetical protein
MRSQVFPKRRKTMSTLFRPIHEQRLDALQEHLRYSRTITPQLMADVMARACPRFSARASSANANILRLIESGAFVDATLALLALELPLWTLRRLVYDDGDWHCAFSRQPALPAELDETVEASHEILPLALLGVFVEAQRSDPIADGSRPSSVPQVRPVEGHAVCCENFAYPA